MKNQSIIIKQGKNKGKTLAIFAGVHGNEVTGIRALDRAIESINIDTGKVYFVYANPKAIFKGARFIEKNLNRLFFNGNNGNTEEDMRARELMKILDECDVLLDLHATNSNDGEPFIICEKTGFDFAQTLAFPIISTGWALIEQNSTDGYMYKNGKQAFCLECGSIKATDKYLPLALQSIYQFLSYFGSITTQTSVELVPKRFVRAEKIIYKKTERFKFIKEFHDFELLEEGMVFANDDNISYSAEKDECIIFARPHAILGTEACIIAKMDIT
jgi:succinylglutamate desuccinylase